MCYHWGPWGYSRSDQPPETMLVFEDHAATRTILIWVAFDATRAMVISGAWAATTGVCINLHDLCYHRGSIGNMLRWHHSSLTLVLSLTGLCRKRAGPTPNRIDPTLQHGYRRVDPNGMDIEELVSLTPCLTKSATTQTHIQGFHLAHPNICRICDLREWSLKGVVLCIYSCTIFITWGNSRISKRSFDEGPVLLVYQRPKILNQANNSLWWTFASKTEWAKQYTMWPTTAPIATKRN